MSDKNKVKKDKCKHKLEFINEWDIGTSWGGADYMYVFECVHCGEIFEDEGNERSYLDDDKDDGWR